MDRLPLEDDFLDISVKMNKKKSYSLLYSALAGLCLTGRDLAASVGLFIALPLADPDLDGFDEGLFLR